MRLRQEFVTLAAQPDSNIRALCRRYGVSPQTGYRWIRRVQQHQDQQQQQQQQQQQLEEVLSDRSRRPHTSPDRTQPLIEQLVCQLRQQHPAWGGRKIHARLLALGHAAVPAVPAVSAVPAVPAASTISDILRRHGLIDPTQSHKHTPFVRFEHAQPNDLWQMDFVGHFPLDDGGRCHTLTVLDDHSRFCVAVKACGNETAATVQQHLSEAFARYGLPRRILSDNGSPWGTGRLSTTSRSELAHRYTRIGVWMLRLGISISHGRPYHPQTQGKDERFNRTFKAEVIGTRRFRDLPDVQCRADPWRDVYNLQRPHEALAMNTPASRYTPSPRPFPRTLPAIEYGPGELVRRVQADGYFHYKTVRYKISQAFTGYPIALRPTSVDGQLDVFFSHQCVARIDLRNQMRIR